MRGQNKEPIWLNLLKVTAALFLTVLALAIGAAGVWALWRDIPLVWENWPHGGVHSLDGDVLRTVGMIEAAEGLVALGVAYWLGKATAALCRKSSTREK